ncbi:hypothetical protein [Streptomyces sp. NPDC020983]|uniref:hypothetical protein n=1 Tax=Streptomyces sp. NPDC020983 TaxID=3365106 RepID=UPI0037B95148
MTLVLALACAGPNCLALHLGSLFTAAEARVHAEESGWEITAPGGVYRDVCPACRAGRGPVLERGLCPVCMGTTVDLPEGMRCHYCDTVTLTAEDATRA